MHIYIYTYTINYALYTIYYMSISWLNRPNLEICPFLLQEPPPEPPNDAWNASDFLAPPVAAGGPKNPGGVRQRKGGEYRGIFPQKWTIEIVDFPMKHGDCP